MRKHKIKELKCRINKGVEHFFPKCGKNFANTTSQIEGDDLGVATEMKGQHDGLERGKMLIQFYIYDVFLFTCLLNVLNQN